MLSKFDLAVIIAAIAGGAFWLEYCHRTVIEAPTLAELVTAAPACPDNDNVPYSESCLAFLDGGSTSAFHWQRSAAARPAATPSFRAK